MFTYNIGDIMAGCLIILLILVLTYKFSRYYYLKFKYKKCPVCGSKTTHYTEKEHFIGEVNTVEKFYCRDCDWNDRFYF